ncbi:glycosyltransferase family 4 protein [Baaleninema simplex]|uniref:glycosyltransferase family 4 protein n=1 Tax=Baaleninema simplex TaxID=2862350 RepID=UPI0003499437|nr:glycosyltransferase family 4 protein [Baaleninema simplex]
MTETTSPPPPLSPSPPLHILLSAYACRPGLGSEPGISWNLAKELAQFHEIWLLTRENNRPRIEEELQKTPIPALHVVYCDLPEWFQRLNRGQRLVQLHYYLWQIVAYFVGRDLHETHRFDVVHHVTYVKYWSPSFLALLPIPFIWGPVGGGEMTPKPFWREFGTRGKVYELLRNGAQRLGAIDPFVSLTARRSAIAFATTDDTAACLDRLNAPDVRVLSQLGLSEEEIATLENCAQDPPQPARFLSIGRLLHWKGFDLGLRAFAKADLPENVEFWLVGDGKEGDRLQRLAADLGISHRVKFLGKRSREDTLQILGTCTALVHPSLHDSGALVCVEAMAAGRPVLCLDLGGPAVQVTEDTGFKVSASDPDTAISQLAEAMAEVTGDRDCWQRLSDGGRNRIRQHYRWSVKSRFFKDLYERLCNCREPVSSSSLTKGIP